MGKWHPYIYNPIPCPFPLPCFKSGMKWNYQVYSWFVSVKKFIERASSAFLYHCNETKWCEWSTSSAGGPKILPVYLDTQSSEYCALGFAIGIDHCMLWCWWWCGRGWGVLVIFQWQFLCFCRRTKYMGYCALDTYALDYNKIKLLQHLLIENKLKIAFN